ELAGLLQERLAAKDMKAPERDELVQQLARFARSAPVQAWLAERLRDSSASGDAQIIVLRAMAQAGLKEAPEAWIAGVTQVLTGKDTELLHEAVAGARALRIPKPKSARLAEELHRIAGDSSIRVEVRINALAAMPGGLAKVDPDRF